MFIPPVIYLSILEWLCVYYIFRIKKYKIQENSKKNGNKVYIVNLKICI